MKTPKKTASKKLTLVSALKRSITKKPSVKEEAARIRLNNAIRDGSAVYDEYYDAYYDSTTGKWLESRCKYMDCPYCNNRPKKKKL